MPNMKVIAIAAVAKNGVIGNDLELPWSIPEDMQFFRDSTREQIVVMGRKTYQALKKALPKRENAVITRDLSLRLPDAQVFQSVSSAIESYRARPELADKTIFIIGGAEIYKLSLDLLDEVWLTEIDAEFAGNIFFPEYKNGKFLRKEFLGSDMKKQGDFKSSPYRYRFVQYLRT
jgi:dihydrofolate reductase